MAGRSLQLIVLLLWWQSPRAFLTWTSYISGTDSWANCHAASIAEQGSAYRVDRKPRVEAIYREAEWATSGVRCVALVFKMVSTSMTRILTHSSGILPVRDLMKSGPRPQ